MVLCSTLWSLCLVRNEQIFMGKGIKLESVFYLTQLSSFEWCVTANLIKEDLDFIWRSNP